MAICKGVIDMINDKRKVLILSAPVGSGHDLAALALEEAFNEVENCVVVRGNAFSFFPGFLGTAFIKFYHFILRFFPEAYALSYRWGNNPKSSYWLRGMINFLLGKLAAPYLKKLSPDVVVATHATAAGIVDAFKHNYTKLPLVSVVTDFTVHQWWIHKRTNIYFLAADDLKPTVVPRTGQKIFCYGIPVRQEFDHEYDNNELKSIRMKYSIKRGVRTVLLMGGGDGLLPMEDIITSITNNYPVEMQFVAVTGHNASLARQLKRMGDARVVVLGFVRNIAELMNACDYLVSKAGAVTAAEALTTAIKYILYNPRPGQESANADYLEKIGAAKRAECPFDVAMAIKAYDKDNNLFLGAMGQPQAAKKIVETIMLEIK